MCLFSRSWLGSENIAALGQIPCLPAPIRAMTLRWQPLHLHAVPERMLCLWNLISFCFLPELHEISQASSYSGWTESDALRKRECHFYLILKDLPKFTAFFIFSKGRTVEVVKI